MVYNLLTLSVPTDGYCRNAYMLCFFSVSVRFIDIEKNVGHSLNVLFIITSHLKSLIIYTPTKVMHHLILLSMYFFTSILLKQWNRYHHFPYTSKKATPWALKLLIYEVFSILKDVTMTWQKGGSEQALEKRNTSLLLMEVFSIALKCRVFRF